MKSTKNSSKLLTACIALISFSALLQAGYYKPDFFPIGLSGLNYTGDYSTPYRNVKDEYDHPLWEWDNNQFYEDQTEKALIKELGVNCLGCSDCHPTYLINLNPNSYPSDNYLNKICKPSRTEEGWKDTVYLMPNGLYIEKAIVHGCAKLYDFDTTNVGIDNTEDYALYPWEKGDRKIDSIVGGTIYYREGDTLRQEDPALRIKEAPDTFTNPDSLHRRYEGTPCNHTEKISAIFRTWVGAHQYVGYGSDEFIYPKGDPDGAVYDYQGESYYGDDAWCDMMDTCILNLEDRFEGNSDEDNIIGWNLLVEDPAYYRGPTYAYCDYNPHKGSWGAVNRMLTGEGASDHDGVRGVEGSTHRMVIAKGSCNQLHANDINIFQDVPELDAVIEYHEGWCRAKWNYGEEKLFDYLLYGPPKDEYEGRYWERRKFGIHNAAIYMQKYGNDNIQSGQKRRWIGGLALWWTGISSSDQNCAKCRRPCPPEIRCATYLCLSRGAKGIMYMHWLTSTSKAIFPSVKIPATDDKSGTKHAGMRDPDGYPFGYPGRSNHYLNNGQYDQGEYTYWHSDVGRIDRTYTYLKEDLIPEIKKIAPKLMELDWVNAYSLNSIAPDWRSLCPHYYVEDVWGAEFMDLAFFDHPYEPVGVEYFILVNREGIADMTNRTVSVALDAQHWPEEDSLILSDIANAENPRMLTREGERFTFTEVFEPGEGKLYRVAPTNEAPITLVPSTEGGVR